jgi:hypothetical protein
MTALSDEVIAPATHPTTPRAELTGISDEMT